MDDKNKKEWKLLFKGYFIRYVVVGVILIFSAFIIDFNFIPSLNGKHKFIEFVLEFLKFFCSTLGIALLVAAVFTYSIETANFIGYIKSLLMKIVATKDFLKTLNNIDKKVALKRILTPSNEQINIYSNISEFFDEHIIKSLQLFNTNFKTHFSIVVKAKYLNNKVVLEETFNYRLYKIRESYEPLVIAFADSEQEFVKIEVISHTGKTKVVPLSAFEENEREESGFKWNEYRYSLNDEFLDSNYVNISFTCKEIGNDHWVSFGYKSTIPTDGISIDLRCEDDLIIKNSIIYDNDKKYSHNTSEGKKELNINSPQWIDKGSGLHVLIAKK